MQNKSCQDGGGLLRVAASSNNLYAAKETGRNKVMPLQANA